MVGTHLMWSRDEIRLLKKRHSEGLFYTEIADELGRKSAVVRFKARQLGLKSNINNGRMGEWNQKHAHLREAVLKYFLHHTWSDTLAHFEFTRSELKSCLSGAYMQSEWSNIRKDKRPHIRWSQKERIFLLKHSGIRNRKWIARKTKRSETSYHTVKEELKRLGIGSKYINGIPRDWFREIAPNVDPWTIKTKAGPKAEGVDCCFVLVPWVECWKTTKHRRNIHPVFRQAFQAMATFQKFLFQERDDDKIKKKLKRMVSYE